MRDTIICLVCVVGAVVLLTAASSRLESINSARRQMGLVSNEPLENAPPSLAFATVAMGAFRGLVVDVLWMRADKLKEKGQFFDAKQLAEWISILQPRFAAVWDVLAWNMAYNISAAIPASQWQERWRWVRNGYELLRDKGIEKNPGRIILYRALAYIFQHKIGGVTDDCHKHYKRELALAMRGLLGEEPANEYFQRLSATKKTLSEITAEPDIAEFISAIKEADKAFEDNDELIGNYLSLRQTPDRFSESAFEVIDRFRGTEALDKFDTFAKAYRLRNTWKLKPELMDRLNKKYGPYSSGDPNDRLPLNWEHANTHAIYWAELGFMIAGEKEEYSIDEKNTDRIISHALQDLYRRGNLVVYPVPGELASVYSRPDLRMFEVCDKDWAKRIKKYEAFEHGNPKGLRDGHRNFLKNSVIDFYQTGNREKAGRIYQRLREVYPRDEFKDDMHTWVKKRIVDEIEEIKIKDATELTLMTLRDAYFSFAIRADDEAFGKERWAREVYEIYQAKYSDEEWRRLNLPDFEMIRFMAFLDFMRDRHFPEHLRNSLLGRIKVERPELFDRLQKQKDLFIQKTQQNQTQ
ncbi:MAG TPA: hypothetical protein HPP51_02955 [Planctomycetes bacterium]|nr:hypothetical protein [Planctomycetota bacterium]